MRGDLNKSFIYSLLEKLIDKKFFSETWYNYLTGEWHSPFPELEGFKGIMDRRWFFTHFPTNLIVEVESPWRDFGKSWFKAVQFQSQVV
jgi:hypothetical protein